MLRRPPSDGLQRRKVKGVRRPQLRRSRPQGRVGVASVVFSLLRDRQVAAAVVGVLTADPVQRRRLLSMASLPTRRPRICWTVRQSQIPSFRTLWKMEDHFFSFMLNGSSMEHLLAEAQEGQWIISFSGSKYDDCCSNNDASVRGWRAVQVYVPVVPVQIVERNSRGANSESNSCMLSRTAHRLEMSSPSAHLNRTSSPTSGLPFLRKMRLRPQPNS